MDSFKILFNPNAIELEDYEVAYLWGGVYYWLKRFVSAYNNEESLALAKNH